MINIIKTTKRQRTNQQYYNVVSVFARVLKHYKNYKHYKTV